MPSLRIALLQFQAAGNQDANVRRGLAACEDARAWGAAVALFPEMWNYVYATDEGSDGNRRFREPALTNPFLGELQAAARQLEMAIAISYLEKRRGGRRDRVALFDRHGTLALHYAKVHICAFADPESHLTPGTAFPVYSLKTGAGNVQTGCMICFDREFPESVRLLMLNGAQLIPVPNSCELEENRLAQLRARAFENMTAVANYPKPHCNGHTILLDGIAIRACRESWCMTPLQAENEVMSDASRRQIKELSLPRGSIGLWWFGQNRFISKSPESSLASVDLYLTDSCASLPYPVNLSRQIPILLSPAKVEVDMFACTRNHQDHSDPETIRNLTQNDTMVGPHPSCSVFEQAGVESGRISPICPESVLEPKDLRLTGKLALPTDSTDLNHMGFVLQFGNGPRIYITGDTDHHELRYSVTKHQPGLVSTCINGGFNNLSACEAAQLVSVVKPKAAIPCHYDGFPDNCTSPSQFRAALQLQAPSTTCHELAHGSPFVFSAT
jgi:predicted amidohydrolase/L-ascorbate metabolism protein UlaG (beta-lactamase superfamily)